MVIHLDVNPDDMVVEIGPGTGVFTEALLNAGVRPENLILLEREAAFAQHLRKQFSKVKIIEGDACQLMSVIGQETERAVTRVISGLPLRSMPREVRRIISSQIAELLPPGGILVQFSYFEGSPIDPDLAAEAGLMGRRVDHVLRNLPPAYVWKYVKVK
ncbi:MAG: methyltransferase domain-containing protein [Alphaproteobacteria bacterium]|nr:methyltransferase domain-containing protein [Alphaproteobacteria bacterium]